jgi:hypothetical protein
MTICDYSDRLEIVDGELCRIVTAYDRKDQSRKLDVYREFESGKTECRNLYYSMYGYMVGFPDEINSYYKNSCCTFIQKLDDYGACNEIKKFYSFPIGEKEKSLIVSKYPDFRYVLNKYNDTIKNTMLALNIWKKHKEVEYILASGFVKVALNKAFWKLSKNKQKEIAMFIRKNPMRKDLALSDIQAIIKYNLSESEFGEYKTWCVHFGKCGYEIYKYLMKCNKADYEGLTLYRDYMALLKQTLHDRKEDYWRFPKKLQKKHDELREEVARIEELKRLETLRAKQEKYLKAVEKYLPMNYDIDGYTVFVPGTVEEIDRQAKELHQCLITCDYISRVIKGECVLVFVQKNGKPIATAELKKGNKIGQFYANELNRDNCLPTDEVRAVMNKWIGLKKAA